jgi:uncharacterized protein YjlB
MLSSASVRNDEELVVMFYEFSQTDEAAQRRSEEYDKNDWENVPNANLVIINLA